MGRYQTPSGPTIYIGPSQANVIGSAIQAAINLLGATGGSIILPAGNVTMDATPLIPSGLTGRLRIAGQGIGGTVVKLGATLNTLRFLNLNVQGNTSDATFQHITVEDLTCDCQGFDGSGVGTTGQHHVVLGTCLADGSATSASRINLDDIHINRVQTLNVPTKQGSGTDGQRRNTQFTVGQALNDPTTNTVTNITIEDCEFNGGIAGAYVGGAAFNSNNVNVFVDRIFVLRNRIKLYADAFGYPVAGQHSPVQIGIGGFGDLCVVWGNEISNSGDVGVEIDSMTDVIVENNRFRNVMNGDTLFLNFNARPDPTRQIFRSTNNWSERVSPAAGSGAFCVVGDVGGTFPIGTVLVTGGKVRRTGGDYSKSGMVLSCQWGIGQYAKSITVKDTQAEFSGLDNAAGNTQGSLFYLNASDPAGPECPVTIKDNRLFLSGLRSGAGLITLYGIHCAGAQPKWNLDAEGNVWGISSLPAPGGTVAIVQANAATGAIRGQLRRNTVLAANAGVTGWRFYQAGAAVARMVIRDNDLNDMLTTALATLFTLGGFDAVHRIGPNRMPSGLVTGPAAAVALSGSGVGVQVADGYDGVIHVTGGTFTLVEWSPDGGTTYYPVGGSTSIAFPVATGDFVRITYTVAPTVTKIRRY